MAQPSTVNVLFIPCFLDGNATSTIPHKYASRQKTAFDCGCADVPGRASREGSHFYEINTWLWSFGRPQPRIGGLFVSKAQRIRKASRSEAAKRAWVTKRARESVWLGDNDGYILGIYQVYTAIYAFGVSSDLCLTQTLSLLWYT